MIERIQFTKGCLNECSYCYEKPPIETFNPEIPKADLIQILDMNFLCNPNALKILKGLPRARYELICGLDFRRLTPEICGLLKDKGFVKIRWAWDYGFSGQRKQQFVWRMLKGAGFRSEELSVFMIINWRIPYIECIQKLDLLKVWCVKVNDCCFDGGYPKSEIDFNNNPRFNGKRFWAYPDIKRFRRMCRKHNQLVRFKIDPEAI